MRIKTEVGCRQTALFGRLLQTITHMESISKGGGGVSTRYSETYEGEPGHQKVAPVVRRD